MEIAESCSVPISLVFDAEFGDQIAGVRSIYVIGQIRYEDEAGAQRFMDSAECAIRMAASATLTTQTTGPED